MIVGAATGETIGAATGAATEGRGAAAPGFIARSLECIAFASSYLGIIYVFNSPFASFAWKKRTFSLRFFSFALNLAISYAPEFILDRMLFNLLLRFPGPLSIYSKVSFKVSNTVIVSEVLNLPRNFPDLIITNEGILVRPQYPSVYLFTSTSHLYQIIVFGIVLKRELKSSFLHAPHQDAVKYTTAASGLGFPSAAIGFRRSSNWLCVRRGIICSLISIHVIHLSNTVHYVAAER